MSLTTQRFSGDHQQLVWAAELQKPPATKQQQSESSNCPRCGSTNTKFCYYNNYNKSQPRHFCKSCKRHWTKGGTLRNVPVGGVRKNKRPKIPLFAAANNSPTQQNCTTLTNTGCDQKHISSNILHQDLLVPSNSFPLLHETIDGINFNIYEGGINTATDLNASAEMQNPRTESPFSCVSSTFKTETFSIPSPCPFLNSYDDHYVGNLDTTEGSTVTTIFPTAGYNSWYDPDTSTAATDLSNYWNWNEIDGLDSNNHLNTTWYYGNDYNDTEIKP